MRDARCVERELLDHLPADDRRAIVSRRDLQRINTLMLHRRFMRNALIDNCPHRVPRVILELGAGDGTFMLRLGRRLASMWPNVKVILLDRHDAVRKQTRQGFSEFRWDVEVVAADAFEFLCDNKSTFDIVTANLFLHHFQRDRLHWLLSMVANATSCFIACEPRRAGISLTACRLLWLIGCNYVSRHDALASVHAGFCDDEISCSWSQPDRWALSEYEAGIFSHCFTACRTRP
jgi:hypothetical protein